MLLTSSLTNGVHVATKGYDICLFMELTASGPLSTVAERGILGGKGGGFSE